jgi:glyoxylase-like metal-dependent hydrolase (beta-lactamase superfamily II)
MRDLWKEMQIMDPVIPVLQKTFAQVFFLPAADHGGVLIDTSVAGQAEAILQGLAAHGFQPHDVRLILITHGHNDHLGSAAELRQRTGAPVAIHALDAEAARSGKNPSASLRPTSPLLRAVMALLRPLRRQEPETPSCPADIAFEQEWRLDEYGVAGKVLHTPGHTAGSASVLLDSGEAVVGDLVTGPMLPWGRRFGLPFVAMDVARDRESIRRLAALQPAFVYVTHGRSLPGGALQVV